MDDVQEIRWGVKTNIGSSAIVWVGMYQSLTDKRNNSRYYQQEGM